MSASRGKGEAKCPDADAFVAAAGQGDLQAVSEWLTFGDADQKNARGDTALMEACYHGQCSTATLLLERGASVNLQDGRYRNTALMWASNKAGSTENLKIIRLLSVARADPNCVNTSNHTAIMEAACMNRVKVMQALLENFPTIDLEKANKEGKTVWDFGARTTLALSQTLLRLSARSKGENCAFLSCLRYRGDGLDAPPVAAFKKSALFDDSLLIEIFSFCYKGPSILDIENRLIQRVVEQRGKDCSRKRKRPESDDEDEGSDGLEDFGEPVGGMEDLGSSEDEMGAAASSAAAVHMRA